MTKMNGYIIIKIKLLVLFFVYPFFCFSFNETTTIYDSDELIQINSKLFIYEDKSSVLTIDEVLLRDSFVLTNQKVPNLGMSSSSYWIKFSVKNETKIDQLILGLTYPIMDFVELYQIQEGKGFKLSTLGDEIPFDERKYKHQNFLFDLDINHEETKHYVLKIRSWEQISVPLILGKPVSIFEANLTQDLIFGLFFGIMLVLVLYNLFIFFTVKDNSYLYYVFYIFFITLTQAALNGYTFRLFFSNFPEFTNISLILFNSIAAIVTIEFIKLFIKTKEHTPLLHKGFSILTIVYICGILTGLIGLRSISYTLMDIGGILIAIYTLFIAIKISLKGFRPAKIFLFAWSIFLLGIILFVLKSVGILQSNLFTNYTMTFGIAIEGIILSIALADRINILRRQKEESQLKTVAVLKENEKIITEQNIILEEKVEKRTNKLNQTLINLREAQSRLVDAEKMSSLGQLTAGIAHEINNPINFVSSNITPLRQDLEDINAIIKKYEEIKNTENLEKKLKEIEILKKELDFDYLKTELSSIINGIEEGARRTKEIVNSLRNFSHLDKGELSLSNINDGIESTVVLIRNKLDGIKIDINFGKIPDCECNPGKINQLTMNLIDNAIYAIHKKDIENNNGKIILTTSSTEEFIEISIKDNGIGIHDNIKDKLFDPFFTNKDVGEGTGLGLSIVRSIVDGHKGSIKVNSIVNEGTEIIIKIPIKSKSDGKN